MTVKRITRRLIKFIAFILGGLLILLISFHLWFINYSETIVEELVRVQSNGQLKLKVHRVKFNWFTYRMELRKPVFYSNDTSAVTSYQLRMEKMNIRLKEIWPLLFEKRILIDSLHLYNPDIRVTRLRAAVKDSITRDRGMSLPKEMGRIYNSIQDALNVLNVDRFQIDNGKFSLLNQTDPDETPVSITNINILLDNLKVDSTRPGIENKILFSDNFAMHTFHQDILFPDGRHRLSFRNFRINILKKIVEFDSCTVVATKGDSTDNSFRIFFDKLQMTNIDFNALYHSELIKADSVYCTNPRFRLDISLPDKKGQPKSSPSLTDLIQQLTGDMQLAFVVVDNGSFDINTVRNGRPSSFTSNQNNFELQGLAIKKNSPKPLAVDKFVMAIRNYENFIRDSTYAIQFDSILINNNRISLSNFTYTESEKDKKINSLEMPQFELQGLFWDDLVLDQKLKAKKVILYRPVINYSLPMNKQSNPSHIFNALAGIGNFMQLDILDIADGSINLFLNDSNNIKLENTSLTIQVKQLTSSRGLINAKRSVKNLRFRNGQIKIGNVTARLNDVKFHGGETDQLFAGSMLLKNKNGMDIAAAGVLIRSLFFDDQLKHALISGINWSKASMILPSLPVSASIPFSFSGLKKIRGENTTVLTSGKGTKISLFLEHFIADEITIADKRLPVIKGLTASGNRLSIERASDQLKATYFSISDNQTSFFQDLNYIKKNEKDSVSIQIPRVDFTADINTLLDGKIDAAEIRLADPHFYFSFYNQEKTEPGLNSIKWPESKIGSLQINNPVFQYSNESDVGTAYINWNGSGNKLEAKGISIRNTTRPELSIDQVSLSLSHFFSKNSRKKIFDTGEGQLSFELNQMELKKNEINNWEWKTFINKSEVKNLFLNSIDKRNGTLHLAGGRLFDFSISTESMLNMRDLLSSNASFRLEKITGSYANIKHQFNWYNGAYNNHSKFLSVDSFSYQPAKNIEEFLAALSYQADYATIETGAVSIGPFNIDRFLKDSLLDMGTIRIINGKLCMYRDKRKPRKPGVIRSLPSNQLKKIPAYVQADHLSIKNAFIEYEELSDKTGKTGKVMVAGLDGSISGLRNYNIKEEDSLNIFASARIENKLFTRLKMKESLSDPQGGFLLSVQMDSADLSIFNPVLKSLASAELKSGHIDSMLMKATGNDESAFGKMKLIYHDLKIKTATDNETKSFFGKKILTSFTNTFIKNRNKNNTGTVFFQRLKDRSVLNYLVKITFSGLGSSIGFKKTDRLFRKFKKEKSDDLPGTGKPD